MDRAPRNTTDVLNTVSPTAINAAGILSQQSLPPHLAAASPNMATTHISTNGHCPTEQPWTPSIGTTGHSAPCGSSTYYWPYVPQEFQLNAAPAMQVPYWMPPPPPPPPGPHTTGGIVQGTNAMHTVLSYGVDGKPIIYTPMFYGTDAPSCMNTGSLSPAGGTQSHPLVPRASYIPAPALPGAPQTLRRPDSQASPVVRQPNGLLPSTPMSPLSQSVPGLAGASAAEGNGVCLMPGTRLPGGAPFCPLGVPATREYAFSHRLGSRLHPNCLTKTSNRCASTVEASEEAVLSRETVRSMSVEEGSDGQCYDVLRSTMVVNILNNARKYLEEVVRKDSASIMDLSNYILSNGGAGIKDHASPNLIESALAASPHTFKMFHVPSTASPLDASHAASNAHAKCYFAFAAKDPCAETIPLV